MLDPSLRIGIDARSLTSGPAGIATYVANLVEQISQLVTLSTLAPGNNFLWNQWHPPMTARREKWDLYHAAGYTAPLWGARPLVVTAPDISYLACPQWYPYRLDPLRRRYYEASLRRADRIIVTSHFSASEVVQHYPELASRVRVTHLGVSGHFYPDPEAATSARAELRLPERYLLHVGDIHERRNIPFLVRVAEQLGLPLVLVGRVLSGGDRFQDWPLRREGVTVEGLRGIYSGAEALVYASSYEGFGLPILESMACGTPVIATRTTCIPEVAGEAARLSAPDVDSMSRAVREALEDRAVWVTAGLERAKEFSWSETARQTRRVYAELLGPTTDR